MSAIEVKNLSRSYGDIDAVKDVSFNVPEKSFTVLLGPSGCGKSTILKMLSGLEQVSNGSINIGGANVTDIEASKRGVSMVFQSYALFPHLNVKENIQFGLKVRKVPAEERERKVEEAAKVVGLTELLDRKPANLSGGQRQRVALARSSVSASILIFSPTNSIFAPVFLKSKRVSISRIAWLMALSSSMRSIFETTSKLLSAISVALPCG